MPPAANCVGDAAMTRLPIFVINLKRQPQRLERMRRQLDALGLEFERIDAIDKDMLRPEDCETSFERGGPIGDLTLGEMACAMSHRVAWRRVVESDAPAALVLEDDVALSPLITNLVKDADWIPPSVLLVKADRFGGARKKFLLGPGREAWPGGPTLHRMGSMHMATAATIITRRGAEVLLASSNVMNVAVDHLLYDPESSRHFWVFKPVQLRPAAAIQIQEAESSSLKAERVARSDSSGYDRWRKQVRRLNRIRSLPRKAIMVLCGGRRLRVPFDASGSV